MVGKIDYLQEYFDNGIITHSIQKNNKAPIWYFDDGTTETEYTGKKDKKKDKKDNIEQRLEAYNTCNHDKERIGFFCGKQIEDYIICLDFDVYDRETDGDSPFVLSEFNKLKSKLGRDGSFQYFESSTCGNYGALIELDEESELVKRLEDMNLEKISHNGIEIFIKGNVVLPPTATTCKKHDKICKGRKLFSYRKDKGKEEKRYESNSLKIISCRKGERYDIIDEWITNILELYGLKDKKEKKEKKEKPKEDKEDKEYKQEKEQIEDKENKKEKKKIEDSIEYNNDLIKKLIYSLKPEYCDKYDLWLRVGIGLKNIEQSLSLWDEWSKQSKAYEEGVCYEKWETFEDNNLGLGTLLLYSKDSNEKIYNEICDELSSSSINFGCLTPEIYTIQLIQLLNDDIIFCGKEKDKQCYKWNSIFWEKLDDDYIEIKKKIKNDLRKHMIKLLNTKSLKSEYIKKNKAEIKYKILQYLENSNNYNTIINNLKIELFNNDVEFDKKNNIFQFNNACYDIDIGSFVEPEKKNYITISCGYSYDFGNRTFKQYKIEKDEKYNKEINEIYDFYKSIVDDNSDFLITFNSTGLQRENIEQKALMCYGSGRNGKGMMVNLQKNALGNYFGDIKMDYFTTYDKSADAPNTNLYDCKHSRFIMASEVDEDNHNNKQQSIVASKFKRLTGGDTIQIRKVFDKQQTSFVFGQLCMLVNSIPAMPTDVAMRERMIILPFEYNFVDNPTQKHHKKVDRTLGEKFKSDKYKQGYIRILMSHYKKYKSNGLIIPKKVKDKTNEVFNDMNEIEGWLFPTDEDKSPIVKAEGKKINISDLYELYSSSIAKISNITFGKKIKKISNAEIRISRGKNYLIDYELKPNLVDDDNNVDYND